MRQWWEGDDRIAGPTESRKERGGIVILIFSRKNCKKSDFIFTLKRSTIFMLKKKRVKLDHH